MRPLLLLSASALIGGCEYDLDKIYRYAERDAGMAQDAANSTPAHLIDLYASQPSVDDDCQACANRLCRSENEACRDDAECLRATSCYANLDPDALAQCRAEQLDWFKSDLEGRAFGDPFYTCVFNNRCKRECASSSAWTCLGKYSWNSTERPRISLALQYFAGRGGMVGTDVTTRVCSVLEETTCAGPGVLSDDKGEAEVTLPTPSRSFQGYLELTGGDWYPTLVRFGWPMARDGAMRLGIVTQTDIALNTVVTGADLDAARGVLQLRMYGCGGLPMRDVSFSASSADAKSSTWYYDGETANTKLEATTDWGNGGIINVPVGLARVEAKLGDKLVASTVAPVRAGYLTIVILAPSDMD